MASIHQIIVPSISRLVILLLLAAKYISADSKSSSSSKKSSSSSSSSIYDILESHALPIGLFPKGISDISFDPLSGRFELHLLSPSPCDAKFETRVRYEYNVTGTLGYGQIANLSGVAAQELFLWLPVKGIRVDIPSSGLIYFDVGVVFKQFALSFFETPKDCHVSAMENEGNDIVLLKDLPRITENPSGRFERKHYEGNALRAVS